jgi:hypothetical protein
MNEKCLRQISCIALTFLLSCLSYSAVGQAVAQNLGTNLSGHLVIAAQDQTGVTAPVTIRTMQVSGSSEIPKLLLQNGILPDSDALGLVYAANPNLQSTTFSAGTTLNIPTLRSGTGGQAGEPIKLKVDYDLKSLLLANSSGLKTLVDQNQLSPVLPFAMRTNLIQATDKLSALNSSLNAASASRDFLQQAVDDSNQLDGLALSPASSIADQSRLAQILDDVSAKFDWLTGAPLHAQDPWVKVKAVSGTDGKQIPLLTVCYRHQVSQQDKCEGTFEALTSASSTTDRQMSVGDYFLWAVDYLGKQVSVEKDLRLRNDVGDFTLLVHQ